MKCSNVISFVSLSLFFSFPVFAENNEIVDNQLLAGSLANESAVSRCEVKGVNLPSSDRNALLLSCLAKTSSPENVNALALQQKKLNCTQNAKNKELQGSKKEGYITTCVYKNEVLLTLEAINQRFASSDINELLRQSPTATGRK